MVRAEKVVVDLSSPDAHTSAMLASLDAARAQVKNPARAGVASAAALGRFLEGMAKPGFDSSDLICFEAMNSPASGACEFVPTCGERYRSLITAVARELDGTELRWLHGWPILQDTDGLILIGRVDFNTPSEKAA